MKYRILIIVFCFLQSISQVFADYKPTFIAVGGGSGKQLPLMAINVNNEKEWVFKSLNSILEKGILNHASCVKGRRCCATGFSGSPQTPLLIVSTDGGNNWIVKSLPEDLTNSSDLLLSCSGSGANAICLAAGEKYNGSPLLIISADGGNTWDKREIPMLIRGHLYALNCTGEGVKAICVAVGRDQFNFSGLLASSNDGGKTWMLPEGAQIGSMYHAVSCTGKGASVFCVAIGDTTDSSSFFMVSHYNLDEWTLKNISNIPKYSLNDVTCVGKSSNSLCVAVGEYRMQNLSIPLIVISNDDGKSWQFKTVQGLSPTGYFTHVSCADRSFASVCAAVGYDSVDSSSLLAVSKDGGNIWEAKSIPLIPKHYNFNSVKCAGKGKNATCVAGGGYRENDTQPYLLVASNDGGTNWEIKNIPNRPLCPTRPGSVCSSINDVSSLA